MVNSECTGRVIGRGDEDGLEEGFNGDAFVGVEIDLGADGFDGFGVNGDYFIEIVVFPND